MSCRTQVWTVSKPTCLLGWLGLRSNGPDGQLFLLGAITTTEGE